MSKPQCPLCLFEYVGNTPWPEVEGDWSCPMCGTPKGQFTPPDASMTTDPSPAPAPISPDSPEHYLAEWRRDEDTFETHMADIHAMAIHGKSLSEPMRSQLPCFDWKDILIRGAQLARHPLNKDQPVQTETVIGPGAKTPLVIQGPLFVSHMSLGALSPEAKLALAQGSAMAKTAMCSGEGGILDDSLQAAHRYIFEYVPNRYSATDAYFQQVDAVEIKIGQSAKPGMGGHLPGNKVTAQIAQLRGFEEGQEITSPAHFPELNTEADLKRMIDSLRDKTGGKPIGVKIAAGHLRDDIAFALAAGPDFLTIDGRAGGTGSAPKSVKDATSIPTIFALARAREVLDAHHADEVSLIITGGLRVSSDFAKALALGADAIALATSMMMALGCQQYRICNTGLCPVGIATQDPTLRARLNVEQSAQRVCNYLSVCNEELKHFARLTGNDSVHSLSNSDLCTASSEISNSTGIEHV